MPQLYIQDPCIAGLISNMRAEVEAGCPSDPLYDESLWALATYQYGAPKNGLNSEHE